jgi:hypothetical protein
MVLSQRSSSQRSKNTNDYTRNPEVRRKTREKALQLCKHRSIAASRQHQLEQKAQEDQTHNTTSNFMPSDMGLTDYKKFVIYGVFQKELYNFESLYKFIQRTCTIY